MKRSPAIKMSVVYDNNPYDLRLETDWGFSCFIEGLEKSILFDTGAKGQILLSNMEKLGILPERVDAVVLSHAHRDHTGGMEDFLSHNHQIEVWLPNFFPSKFKQQIQENGATVIEVGTSRKICEGAYTSGVLDGWIKEQSLVLEKDNGLILMTGCAHPRITNIILKTQELFEKDIVLALGGFHLAGFDKKELMEIIEKFRQQNIQKVGPCHCSGHETRAFFHKEYQNDYIEIGVGKEIELL